MSASDADRLKGRLLFIEQSLTGVRLRVLLAPRASVARIIGPHADRLKIAVTAPPVDGAANDALVRFLSRVLHISQSRISIVSGEQSRQKLLELNELSIELAGERLIAAIGKSA